MDLTFQAADGRRSSITVVATDDVGDFPGRRPCEAHSDILDGCVDPSVGLIASPEQLQAGDALTVWQH